MKHFSLSLLSGLLLLTLVACSDKDKDKEPTRPSQPTPPPAETTKGVAGLPMPENVPHSFSTSKRLLYHDVYEGHKLTFYCGCPFNDHNEVDIAQCGVTPRKNLSRATRVEAEHVFPAHQFGNFRQCWREPLCTNSKGEAFKGRECCMEIDEVFRKAHNDLHNLFPAVGEINGDRSNYNWGMISGEKREYGSCDIEVDSSIRRAEPPESVRGDIARVHFYMSATYGFRLSNQDLQLYGAWHRQDPPDEWEKTRNLRIASIQGNDNPFITGAEYDPSGINYETPTAPPSSQVPVRSDDAAGLSCATKLTCGELSTCEAALFQLQTCGNRSLDGDGDGVPCASLCRDYPRFSCEPSKTCGEMTSCQEAQFHLTECGNTRLDRDGDGVPCQAICGDS